MEPALDIGNPWLRKNQVIIEKVSAMSKNLKSLQVSSIPWLRKVERFIALHQKSRALRVLDRVVDSDMPLFWDDPAIQEDRRLAWLYRIDLLRDWGRYSEALAWTCLECELNPENIAAQALKERLKKELHLNVKLQPDADKRSCGQSIKGLWVGVAGMREVKVLLERDVILPLQEPELYKLYGLSLPNGVLLYGPPGCGKTFIAKKLAEILKFKYFEIKPSDIGSIYVHGGQKRIGALFAKARDTAPSLIFFDDLDALAPDRSNHSVGHHYSAEVNELQVQLNKCWQSKVLVVGATNFLEKIDPAILRPGRIDKKVFIGPPDLEARIDLLRVYMQDRPQESLNWLKLAEQCEYYTAAELEHVVNEAARLALAGSRRITEEDILKALYDNPPSLDSEKVKKAISPIGFLS